MPPMAASHDQIAKKAYELYRARGANPGRDLDDWLQAEKEVAKGEQHKHPESSYQHSQKSRQAMQG